MILCRPFPARWWRLGYATGNRRDSRFSEKVDFGNIRGSWALDPYNKILLLYLYSFTNFVPFHDPLFYHIPPIPRTFVPFTPGVGAKLSRLYRFRLGKSLYDLQIFGYLSHTSFYEPQAVSHFRESVQEGLAFRDRYYRVYRYLLSYTKRYHGDLYVLVLDKYAETFPAQTRGSNKGCRAKQIAPRRVRTCGLYKSVLELWYALWHSGKRLPLGLGMQGRGIPLCLAARYDGIEAAGPVFSQRCRL